jgi:hypothetical protein
MRSKTAPAFCSHLLEPLRHEGLECFGGSSPVLLYAGPDTDLGFGESPRKTSVLDPDPWARVLVVYLVGISVWTGIESAHARADLPTEEEWTRTE